MTTEYVYPHEINIEGPEGRGYEISNHGLSKLELFASMAMQGILASSSPNNVTIEQAARSSVHAAKCLIDELDRVMKEGET